MALVAMLVFHGWNQVRLPFESSVDHISIRLTHEWYQLTLLAEKVTEGYRGPIAARAYGHIGLAAYEAALPALDGQYESLGRRFPGLKLPAPPGGELYLPAVLHGCYGKMLDSFFATAPASFKNRKKQLEEKWNLTCRKETNLTTFNRSITYGAKVASAVFKWSSTDTFGLDAHLQINDPCYNPPKGNGKWAPSPTFPLPALLPHWGKVRSFVIDKKDFLAKPLPPFSTQPSSIYYLQALEVFTLNSPLSTENLWIAEYWSDDQPGLTFTPAGRWISIANQVLETENPGIEKTLETYLKLGIVLNDAAIACWHSKYFYNLERPEAYINKVFDPNWHPVHHAPPFPSYPSGHSMIGAAAAEVLTQLFGENFAMTDKSHADRYEFKGTPRSYQSFYEMAFESAFSRILLGVHYRMDCEEGIRLGMLVGKEIGKINLHTYEKHFGKNVRTAPEDLPMVKNKPALQ